MKLTKLFFLCISVFLISVAGFAQDRSNVSGTVTDESGLPVPGATVMEKGTQNAALSDIDGKYSISVGSNATLVISFIGYTTQEIAVAGKTVVNVKLNPQSQSLDEVVVIGYGVQKKSVVTGAITQVKAEALEGQPVTRVETALQGRTSGVLVTASAGQPGSSASVRVRGVTTYNNSDPLYVVDGMILDPNAVQVINPADIESIEVLKDASAAVYGTLSAGGVILITTKKGKAGKLTVTYNGFGGFSEASRKLELLNATEYATIMNERYLNGGGVPANIPYPNPSSYGTGTDWQNVIFKKAYRQSHDLSVAGGGENSKFYMSFSLVDQGGIVLPEISNYNRKTIRINSDHKINKFLKVGQTATYSYEKSLGIGNTNSEFGGPLSSAINLDPLTPLVVTDPAVANSYPYGGSNAQNGIFRDGNGNPYGISTLVTNEMSNPLAYQESRRGQYGYAHNINGNVYAEIEPLAGLKYRSTASGKYSFYGSEGFTPEYYFNSGPPGNNDVNSIWRNQANNFYWSIENTLGYDKKIGDHSFALLLGQGFYQWKGERGQSTTYRNLPIDSWSEASFGFNVPQTDRITNAWTGIDKDLSSLFARLTYNYKEKYLVQGLVRRDGSSLFGANKRFGTFPSVSLGWVVSKEEFWPENDVVTFLKFRGSWGKQGNDKANSTFPYASLVYGGNDYTVGGVVVPGYTITVPPNPDVAWEETTQSNVAAEISFFKSLNVTVDVWKKVTDGILDRLTLPSYAGLDSPLYNIGKMENTGLDIEASFNKKVGDFQIGLSGNISFLKNKLVNMTEGVNAAGLGGVQSMSGYIGNNALYAIPGESYGVFYGLKTQGIFQNQEEIDSYVNSTGQIIQPNAVPGDFRYQDTNDDGQITGDDYTVIGKALPDYSYGFTINLEYKNFDFNMMAQGVAGNQIFDALRRIELPNSNYRTTALERWTGEGTSNTYPRISTTDPNGNFTKVSSFFLQDGDYLRIKTAQLGYSLPSKFIDKSGFSKVRVYMMGENLLTFTKYTGYDPEISGGIDRGFYPQARSYMLGVNLQF